MERHPHGPVTAELNWPLDEAPDYGGPELAPGRTLCCAPLPGSPSVHMQE